jgi:predicted nucleotidyltransferase
MNRKKIISEFKEKVLKFYPKAEIYLYGSQARGTQDIDSDYDVLIVLTSVTQSSREKIFKIAWEIGFKSDVIIVPLLSSANEFSGRTESPFYLNVKREGIRI